ncbi:MAG: ABC transporter substrate-binding protein [Sphaerochaetaceae bacterium]
MKRNMLFVVFVLLATSMLFAGGGKEVLPQQPAVDQQPVQSPSVGVDFDSLWQDPNMPKSWFAAPRTASELGIGNFNQSPYLDQSVKSGAMPSVKDRLPKDPPVVEPYDKVGKYGGTLIVYGVDLERTEFTFFTGYNTQEGINIPTPDGQGYVPWFAQDIEFIEGDTVIQITFRDGLKWSDGVPFKAGDEYEFYWNYTLDKSLFDTSLLMNPLEDIVKIDENTIQLRFGSPVPTYNYELKHSWIGDMLEDNMPLAPMHIMKQNLPAFIGEAAALDNAKSLGFNSVESYLTELTQQVRKQSDPRFKMPTMHAYVITSRSESELLMERNAYYPFVDTKGNQLPYIDKLMVRFAAHKDNIELQAMSGAADIAMTSLSSKNIPVYIANEGKGNYKTHIFLDASLNKPFYSLNLTMPEGLEKYEPYFRNADFRKALSLAINRDQLNDRFYFGKAIPMQVTIAPMSDLFKPEYGNAYAQFDPVAANKLLDSLGLIDKNNDGFRDFPDGSPFKIQMLWSNASYLSDIGVHEYVVSNWGSVGIQVTIQTVGIDPFWDRSAALDWELKPHLVDGSLPYPLGLVRLALTPVEGPEVNPFGRWGTYFLSDGQSGDRPPADLYDEVEMLFTSAEKWLQTLDDQYLVPILESQAKNIWAIGTVGFTPYPIIVNNRLKNVPEKILWDEAIGRERILYPMQWYIEE